MRNRKETRRVRHFPEKSESTRTSFTLVYNKQGLEQGRRFFRGGKGKSVPTNLKTPYKKNREKFFLLSQKQNKKPKKLKTVVKYFMTILRPHPRRTYCVSIGTKINISVSNPLTIVQNKTI